MQSLLLDDQLCFALYSAGAAMNKVYRKLLRNLDLTYPQYLIMMALWETDGVSFSVLGKRLFMEHETLLPLIAHLEASHLVSVTEGESDAVEHRVITLNESGRAMAVEARSIYDQVRCAVPYGPSEFANMKHGLELLREKLADV
jgi:DNA-binding MarR family transcriptional regulator